MNQTFWRILLTSLLSASMLTVLSGCGKEAETDNTTPSDGNVSVQSVSLNHTTLTLEPGQNSVLVATVSPSNATNRAVQWASDNTSVAAVNEGLVTALKAGTAKITVKTDDGGKTATCAVTVVASVAPSMTIGAEKITAISAQLNGKANLGSSVSSDLVMGIMWSKESGVLPSNSKKVEAKNMDKENNYSVDVISLEPETTYYYRSFVTQNGKDDLGEIKEFTTKALSTLIETLEVVDITETTATVKAKLDLTDIPGSIQYGFYYGTDKINPVGSIIGKEPRQNTLSVDLGSLTPGAEYGYKPWISFVSDKIGYKGRLHFKLDWNGTVKTVTVTETQETAQAPNGAATKWLWIGIDNLVGLYETSPGIFEITIDVDTDWGFLIRTDPENWGSAKWGGTGKRLGFGVPFPLTNFSAEDITFSGGREYCGEAKSFMAHPTVVDLGLSVKWAQMNLGATSPVEYGDYYAWGEIETKDRYYWTNYKWCKGSETTLTKYNTDASYGEVDNKTVLDPEDDVAHVKLGDKWRMPTKEEVEELIGNCDWTEERMSLTRCLKGTSKKNGQSIILPASGNRSGSTTLYYAGYFVYFWTSSVWSNNLDFAYCFQGYYEIEDKVYDSRASILNRTTGCPIRPVKTK